MPRQFDCCGCFGPGQTLLKGTEVIDFSFPNRFSLRDFKGMGDMAIPEVAPEKDAAVLLLQDRCSGIGAVHIMSCVSHIPSSRMENRSRPSMERYSYSISNILRINGIQLVTRTEYNTPASPQLK